MAQQPKRKRIEPIPVTSEPCGASTLQPALQNEATRPGPVEYQTAPSTLPGRRMRADISQNFVVDYKELLKQNGVDPKELRARKAAEAAAAKQTKPASGPPKLPGTAGVGGSPSAVKVMYGNVIDRLERLYAAPAEGDESDEGEEGETDDGEEAESSGDGSSGESSSGESEDGDEEEEGAGTGAEQTDAGGGGASDSAAAAGAAGPKKRRTRRPQWEAYEEDFIDDEEEIQYAKSRRVKTKYRGFWVNQGPVEVEPLEEAAEEPQRPPPRPRPPRPRQLAGQAAGKANNKQQQQPEEQEPQEQMQPQKQKAAAAPQQQQGQAAAGSGGGAAPAAAQAAADGAAATPARKRRPEGDGQQPAGKKRKQPAQVETGAGQAAQDPGAQAPGAVGGEAARATAPAPAPGPGPGAVQQPPPQPQDAPRGLAAFAASLGKTTAKSAAAAAAGGKEAPLAQAAALPGMTTGTTAAVTTAAEPAPAVLPPAPAPAPPATGTGAPAATAAAGAAAGPSGAGAGPATTAAAAPASLRVTARRTPNAPTSLDSLIAECVKKLGNAAPPPSDWPQSLKIIESPLNQLALYLHRTAPQDAAASQVACEQLATALAIAAPELPQAGAAEQLAGALQKKVDKNLAQLASLAAAVQKLAKEAAEAEAAASAGPAAHSGDEELAESAPSHSLETLAWKLKSHVNLYHKLHAGGDDEAALRSLAEGYHIDLALLLRAAAPHQSRPAAQRKRSAKVPPTSAEEAEQRRQQAANIAREVLLGGAASGAGVVSGEDETGGAGPAGHQRASGARGGAGGQAAAAAPPALPPPPTGAPAAAAGAAPAAPAAAAGQEEGHKFPDSVLDTEQREECKVRAAAAVFDTGTVARIGRLMAVVSGPHPRQGPRGHPGLPAVAPVDTCSGRWSLPREALCCGGSPVRTLAGARGEDEAHMRSGKGSRQAAARAHPGWNEELLDGAFRAATNSGWAALIVKVLCHEPEGLKPLDIAHRAPELGFITWPPSKPLSDLSGRLSDTIRSHRTLPPFLGKTSGHRYVLRAFRPELDPMPVAVSKRSGAGGGGGGGGDSVSASPAAVQLPAGAGTRGAREAAGEQRPAPVPFKLPHGDEPTAEAAPAPARDVGGVEGDGEGPADGAEGGGGEDGEGAVPSAQEEEQQCRECVEAAVRAGADRQHVESALAALRSNPGAVPAFKVLCHAGPAGMRPSDIARSAVERRFVDCATETEKLRRRVYYSLNRQATLFAYIGNNYALALFPGVEAVPKPPRGGSGPGSSAPAAADG